MAAIAICSDIGAQKNKDGHKTMKPFKNVIFEIIHILLSMLYCDKCRKMVLKNN